MQATDAIGGAVGTVSAIKGDNLVKADKHEAQIPRASFPESSGKLLFGMTQAQLDAQIEEASAAGNAAIVAGAKVKGTAGAAVGTIESVAHRKVTIALEDGTKMPFRRQGCAAMPTGPSPLATRRLSSKASSGPRSLHGSASDGSSHDEHLGQVTPVERRRGAD